MIIRMVDRVEQSHKILDSLRLENDLYVASASSDYNFVWLRDSFYEVLPYLNSDCGRYERTYWAILDILNKYSWKFDPCAFGKPKYTHEYIHPRYQINGEESLLEWGNCQHDAIGAILYGIAKGLDCNQEIIRSKEDSDTVQNMIFYLNTVEYWKDPDNGMWEENREMHASSLGACIAGLKAAKEYWTVSDVLIKRGEEALAKLLPFESPSKKFDLAQLSLIYPYKVVDNETAWQILIGIENHLLRDNGVIRYNSDSYYNSEDPDNRYSDPNFYVGKEAEWTFGLPWLALAHMQLGSYSEAEDYIKKAEEVMLEDGSLPELYFANSDQYNGNTPLGWSNAMYILAKEELDKSIRDTEFRKSLIFA